MSQGPDITGTEGERLDATVTVDSTFGSQQTQTIELRIEDFNSGTVVHTDTQDVTLADSTDSQQITLSWPTSSGDKGVYDLFIESGQDTIQRLVEVESTVGLISHWTFDDADTNSGTAVDVVGSNDGTITGATTGGSGLASYDSGEAYVFSRKSNHNVAFGKNAFGSLNGKPLSVSVWFNVSTTRNIVQRFIYSQEGVVVLTVDGGNLRGYVTGTRSNSVSTAISIGTTYHAVLTYDGSGTQTLYMNGSQADSQSGISMDDLSSTDRQVRVGAQYDNTENFDGAIDDPRVYGKELTSTEVSDLYNNGSI